MENLNPENWNEERYKELNTYFRIIIEQMLRTNTSLVERQQKETKMNLEELISHFSEDDKERWEEFMELDKLKMQADMWNYLNGNGTRYQPGIGFINPDEDTTW